MAINPNILQETFGYPPDNLEERTNLMIRKSMPVVTFIPSVPQFQNGLDLFTLKPSWTEYIGLLYDNGFQTPSSENRGIRLAFLADNFPTDTFTNEYGENFLQKMTDVASEGAATIAQMFGASSASDVFSQARQSLQKSENTAAKGLGKGMEWIGDLAGASISALDQLGSIGRTASSGINIVDKLMAGSRIDFPMVWKSSAYQPSYSFTVRLYNPYPQDEDFTKKYIIGPIVAIMLLGVPRANDSSTFTWPFLHNIYCPGLFSLNPGFISNITIVKGGDQQQISFQNRMGIVDVRIDVGSLYNSMLAGSSHLGQKRRPTVLSYATALTGQKPSVTSRIADNERFSLQAGDGPSGDRSVGFTNAGDAITFERRYSKNVPNFTNIPTIGIRRNTVSPKVQADATGSPSLADRVSAGAKNVYEKLKALV